MEVMGSSEWRWTHAAESTSSRQLGPELRKQFQPEWEPIRGVRRRLRGNAQVLRQSEDVLRGLAGHERVRLQFTDILHRSTDGLFNPHESRLLAEAAKLQLKAAKTEVLFKMLDSFNKNSIQVTVTWELLDNTLGGRSPRD